MTVNQGAHCLNSFSITERLGAAEGPSGISVLCCCRDDIKGRAYFITAYMEAEEFNFKLQWRHSCCCEQSCRKGLDVIHRQFFHLFMQHFLQPWVECALCKRSALLVIHERNDSSSTVPSGTIKGHPLTGCHTHSSEYKDCWKTYLICSPRCL